MPPFTDPKPYQPSSATLCFGELKEAAIFFDRVIPFRVFSSKKSPDGGVTLRSHTEYLGGNPTAVLQSLISGNSESYVDYPRWFEEKYILFLALSADVIGINGHDPFSVLDESSYDKIQEAYLSNSRCLTGEPYRAAVANFAKKHLDEQFSSVLLPAISPKCSYSEAYITVTLQGIEFIDASQASWDQILEFRKDPTAVSKLRRLRLFIYENYSSKPTSFIEDDLAERLEDYEFARKSVGFKAITGSLSVILSAKQLQAAATAGIIGALIGGPVSALSSAVFIEIGGIAIEIAKQMQAIRELDQGHDLGFLLHARTKLSDC